MIVDRPGRYRLLKDFSNRGSISISTIPSGTILEITQIDRDNCQVIGDLLDDWNYWNLPVELVEIYPLTNS